jgi:signal transduction histidine kinase
MFSQEAEKNGCKIKFLKCSQSVNVEPLELMRIMSNLISNSINHAPGARIIVGCRRKAANISFQVHDNGPGICSNDQQRIFEPHQRGSTSNGSGLGLSIVKELITSNEFGFNIQSELGRGTVFSVDVPLANNNSHP